MFSIGDLMIRFGEDWAKYPTAAPDDTTSNRSFVRLASVYKKMGIRNHAFILALVNPLLKGINPHSTTLTREQKDMIIVECKINPWYFFREVARVPAGSGEEPVPLDANRGNIALWWSFFCHIMILLIQPRQTGKSLCTDELMVYLLDILCQGTAINLMTKDEKLRKENIQRIKDIFSTLPPYLNQRNAKKDSNNMEGISVVSLDNRYLTHLPQASPKDAWNVGRGFTSPIIQMDEPPYCPNIDISLPVMLASAGNARERAERAGAPYGTILTTTAGKRDTKEGAFIYKILEESMPWSEHLFDCQNQAELEKMVKANARGFFQVNATFSHRQLGKDDAWLKQRMDTAKAEGEGGERDFLNVWSFGTESHPLTDEMLKAIKFSENTEPYHEIGQHNPYVIRWNLDKGSVENYMMTRKVIVGVDTSDGAAGDDNALVFTDAESLRVIGVATVNEINMYEFGPWIAHLLIKYKNLTAIIERRSTGGIVMDAIAHVLMEHGEDPFKRMYNKIVQEGDADRERFKEVRQPMGRRPSDLYVRNKAAFGFATSGTGPTARSNLYGVILQNAAKRSSDRIHDTQLINQIAGLTRKNGRVDHANGGHDDCIIAWLLTHWFLSDGQNLSHYGIDCKVMSDIATDRKLTPEQYAVQLEQNAIQERMRKIADEMSNTTDEYVSGMLEHQLRNLGRKLIFEVDQVNNIDQLIASIKDSRKTRKAAAAARTTANTDDDYMASMRRLSSSYRY